MEPVKSRYGLRVRILNKEYVPSLADPQTEYYQSFTKTVTSAVCALIHYQQVLDLTSEPFSGQQSVGEAMERHASLQNSRLFEGLRYC